MEEIEQDPTCKDICCNCIEKRVFHPLTKHVTQLLLGSLCIAFAWNSSLNAGEYYFIIVVGIFLVIGLIFTFIYFLHYFDIISESQDESEACMEIFVSLVGSFFYLTAMIVHFATSSNPPWKYAIAGVSSILNIIIYAFSAWTYFAIFLNSLDDGD